ncbi:MAG: cysteine--tRNA ligase [Spirochaetales bacterium]|nr:cysteine--tRNA ligase [Spirochaetales bacterium]
MGIRIYNTMTRSLEDFNPLQNGKVGMYACGITVYDDAHIGHAMQAVVFDVIRNYLEYRGYEVCYVRNFTDVDDKIIARSQKEGTDALELSAHYIEETRKDLAALSVRPATHEPKVSEYIPEIIAFIDELIKKGHAYESQGDVLFDVSTIREYGKLSHRKLDDLLNRDSDSKKKNPQDFALWKAAKPGEPFWESPWGLGRPGWHIECSAMSRILLGDSFDIHGGGLDLIFPHHENEIAQSESLTGKTMAKYWIHNGLIMVGRQKMSKSLGNFFTIKDALARYTADEIRFLILSNHYTSNYDFSADAFRVARKRVYYFYRTLEQVEQVLGASGVKGVDAGGPLLSAFEQAMDENFNTSKVIAALSTAFSEINGLLAGRKAALEQGLNEIALFLADLAKIAGVLAFLAGDPGRYVEKTRAGFLEELGITEQEMAAKIETRAAAKNDRNFELADGIRDELSRKGIKLLDSPEGTSWELDF